MVRKRFDVEIPDGQHLGFSRDTAGARRAHLFDDETNDLAGHAELFEPEEEPFSPMVEYVYVSDSGRHELSDEDRELAEALGNLVTLAIIAAADAASPHVKRWWIDKVEPRVAAARRGVKSTFKRVSRGRKNEEPGRTEGAAPVLEAGPTETEVEVEVAFREYRTRMTSEEARERLAAALVAREFADAQIEILRDARIEDDDGPVGLESAIRALTPEDVAATLTGILERNPSLLDRGTLTELTPILRGGQADDESAPLKIERLSGAPPASDRRPEP